MRRERRPALANQVERIEGGSQQWSDGSTSLMVETLLIALLALAGLTIVGLLNAHGKARAYEHGMDPNARRSPEAATSVELPPPHFNDRDPEHRGSNVAMSTGAIIAIVIGVLIRSQWRSCWPVAGASAGSRACVSRRASTATRRACVPAPRTASRPRPTRPPRGPRRRAPRPTSRTRRRAAPRRTPRPRPITRTTSAPRPTSCTAAPSEIDPDAEREDEANGKRRFFKRERSGQEESAEQSRSRSSALAESREPAASGRGTRGRTFARSTGFSEPQIGRASVTNVVVTRAAARRSAARRAGRASASGGSSSRTRAAARSRTAAAAAPRSP